MKFYVRVKLSTTNGTRIIWAWKSITSRHIQYHEVDKEQNDKNHLYLVDPEDVIWEKTARVSKKYGVLEVIK